MLQIPLKCRPLYYKYVEKMSGMVQQIQAAWTR